MTMTPVLETHVFRDEAGTVCVDSPRNKFEMLVPMVQACGGIEETAAAYPHLTRAQLHAAMAYDYDHQKEIDKAFQELYAVLGEREEVRGQVHFMK